MADSTNYIEGKMTEKEMDIFILHDSRDKSFTDYLYSGLVAKNLKVWYDKASLEIGNSITEKIEEGIKHCDYGALILSKNLLNNDRYAGKYELPSFKIRQIIENKEIILPIWLDITEKELLEFSPWLTDKVAVKVSDGMDNTIDKIFRKVQKIGKWISADMAKGPKGPDEKRGIWYGAIRHLTFTDADKGNLLKVEVKTKHELRIEIWSDIIYQSDDHWWNHHDKIKNSIGTDDEPKVALDQELKWTIEPGDYTLFFAGNSPNGKIVPHNISYKIDINKIPISIPTPAPIAPIPTPAPTIVREESNIPPFEKLIDKNNGSNKTYSDNIVIESELLNIENSDRLENTYHYVFNGGFKEDTIIDEKTKISIEKYNGPNDWSPFDGDVINFLCSDESKIIILSKIGTGNYLAKMLYKIDGYSTIIIISNKIVEKLRITIEGYSYGRPVDVSIEKIKDKSGVNIIKKINRGKFKIGNKEYKIGDEISDKDINYIMLLKIPGLGFNFNYL